MSETVAPTFEPRSVSPLGSSHLSIPEEALRIRIYWIHALSLGLVHALSLLAWIPSLLSVSGLVLLIVTHVLFYGLGVSIGYHRYTPQKPILSGTWIG